MANLNKVFLIGNLTRDPDLRRTPRGTAVGTFGLAVSRTYTTESGEQKEEVLFVDVDVWGRQAETAREYLAKGRAVFVEGRLRLDTWEDRETKQKRSRIRVVAERVQFLGAPGRPAPVPAEDEENAAPAIEPPPPAGVPAPGSAAGARTGETISNGGEANPSDSEDLPF